MAKGYTYSVIPRQVCLAPVWVIVCPHCGALAEGKYRKIRHVADDHHEFYTKENDLMPEAESEGGKEQPTLKKGRTDEY